MERFSQAADNNKTPILAVLTQWLGDGALVLEVGSGSGQHAVHIPSAAAYYLAALGLFGWVVGTDEQCVGLWQPECFAAPLFSILH